MTTRVLACAVVLTALAGTAGPAAGQTRDPVGPFAIDVRGVSSAMPQEAGWTPLLPPGAVAPARGLGIDFGGHVRVLRFRVGSLAVGGSFLLARATETAPDVSDSPLMPPVAVPGPVPPALVVPDVTTRLTSVAPQVFLNFGHALGWSYLSAGFGQSKVRSEVSVVPVGSVQARDVDSDWVKTFNFGGGAKWFVNDHVGVGFDVRWYQLGLVAATASRPGAPRASLFVAGVGLVLK